MSLNLCFLTGNLTADPDFKELKTGATVAKLRVAVNENFTNRDGKAIERTLFIDVVAWEKTAEVQLGTGGGVVHRGDEIR